MKRNTNKLEEAVAIPVNIDASFHSDLQAIRAEIREIERHTAELVAEIMVILKRQEQLIQALPDLILEKIGFQGEESSEPGEWLQNAALTARRGDC